MGVPKLFRWLSERYPLCVEAVLNTTCKPNSKGHSRIEGTPSDFELPAVREVFDNLYLDLNSIIHNCSHPSDNATDNTLTTPQIAANIFRYISKIVALIRPRKLLYIAVDGVAPRAKMNQQRSRRFRAASDAEKSREALLKAGLSAPGSLFDSNCISPGTVFMEDLNVLLKYFITQKQSEDTIWRNISVLYSGHDVPGEGEHKIMDFIRTQRANPLHDPATSHCFYGTDADLLLLGLASHERYISVLREETLSKEALTAQKRPIIPERFQLVHINVLREYLELEFTPYFTNFEFKIDRLVDDLLLLMSLVGDDFLPGIPAMGIAEHGLEHIFWVYGRTVAALDDYITDGMEISQPRLLRLLSLFNSTMVVDNEFDYNSISDQTFSKEAIEIANTSSQQSASQVPSSSSPSSSDEYVPRTIPLELLKMANTPMANEILDKKPDDPKENLNEEPNKDVKEDTNEDNETKEEPKENVNVNEEVKGEENNENKTEKLVINRPKIHEDRMKSHFEKVQNAKTLKNRSIRNRYYSTKFGSENSLDHNPAFVDALCRHYLDGICWVLRYYLGGCPSWSWYFPYHYAPYIQELAAAAAEWEPPVFDVGAPVLPFQQLLCVLPSASAALVPKTYRALLTSPDSPVAEYYPRTFETDLNGKRNDWESVVLIPFIDAPSVFAAMAAAEASAPLEAPEAARNRNKNEFLYEYAAPSGRSKLVTSPLPAILPKRFLLSSKVTEVRSKEALHSTLCTKWAKAAPSSDATSGCGATALRGATDGKGFPDLGTLGGYDVEFSCRSVKININPSRNRSAILHFGNPLEDPETGTLARTPANSLFGQRILFNWPYFWEGVVSGLFFEPGTANPEDYGRWADEEELARGLLTESCGIELNSVSALLSVAPLDAVVLDPSTGTVVERIYDRDSDPLTVPYNLFDPLHALPSPAAPLSPAAQANNAYRSADTDDFKFYFAPGKALMCREVPGNGESADPAKPWTLRVVREIPLGAHAPRRTPAAAASRLDDERAADGSAWIGLRDMAHRAKISEKTLYRMTGYTRCDKTVVSFMLHSKLSWSVVSGWCRSNPKYGYFEFARSVLDFVLYYKQTFPALFRLVDTEKNPTTSHIVPGNPKASNETLKGFVAWFNTLPFVKGDCAKVPLKTYALSADAIKAIQFENEKKMRTAPLTPPQQQQQQQERVLTVRRDDPNLVHSYPILTVKVHNFNNKSQYSAAFRLGERVMNICNDGLVPIGATGTIIRVKYPVDVEKVKALGSQNPVYDDPIYDILFDEPFCSGTTLGGKCKDFYGYSRNDSQIVPLKFLRASVAPSPQRTSFSSSSSSSSSSSGFPMPGEVPPTNSEPQKRTSVVVKKQKQSQQKTDLKKQPQTDEKPTIPNDNDKTQQKSDLKIVKKHPQTEEKPAAQDDDGKPKQSHKLVIVRKQSLKIERKADPKTNAEDKKQEDSGKQVQSVKIEITRPNRSKPDDAASKKQTPPEKAEEHQQNIVLPPIPQNAILPPIPQNAILPPIPQQQQQPSGVPLPLSFVPPHKESTTVEVTNVDTAKRLELLRKRQLEQQQLQLQQLQKLQAQRRVNLAPNAPPSGANPPKSQNRGGLEPQRPGDSELTWQQKKFFKK